MQVSERIAVDRIVEGLCMLSGWILSRVGLVWGIRSRGWFGDLVRKGSIQESLSTDLDNMVTRGIMSYGIISKQILGEMCSRLSCSGLFVHRL